VGLILIKKGRRLKMESTEQMVKELLKLFLYQDIVNRMDSKDKLIKVYRVNPNIVRVDIKTMEGGINENKMGRRKNQRV
jgi:hypothetical protein